VHLVTVNDYLVTRDADWMGRIYRFLGMSVGTVVSQQDTQSKIAAYAADITYGTNNEYGFDYLRDNMEYNIADRRQRGLNFAIVDEVDSILIDEARTPLIISGQADDNVETYYRINDLPKQLTRQASEDASGDYFVDEKGRQVYLSEQGHEQAEKWLESSGLLKAGSSLYDAGNISLMHHVYAALRAHALYNRDEHYVVQNGEVIIVDEFTGRLMSGRRWSEGLHQAVEAKEGVPIQREARPTLRRTNSSKPMVWKRSLSPPTVRWCAAMKTTCSSKRKRKNMRQPSATFAIVITVGSRYWWAPPRSRTAS
jgi:preprotein translocase subunit SecA